MNKHLAKTLLNDLEKLGELITKVKRDLERVLDIPTGIEREGIEKSELPSIATLRDEWRMLQQNAISHNDINNYINDYIQNKSKKYLRAFLKANDLPILEKDPKEKIAQQIIGLLHVGSTIIGKK